MISIDEIKQLIDQENISVISFDLFDTLVVRECISSKNVISLLSQIIEKKYGIKVKEYRISAEKELGTPFATTQTIWKHIANKMNFSKEMVTVFSDIEFELEKTLIRSRRIGKVLYDYAVSRRKSNLVKFIKTLRQISPASQKIKSDSKNVSLKLLNQQNEKD